MPFTIGERSFAVDGQLRWTPPPPWWPWLLVGAVLVAPPVLMALRRPRGEFRRQALLRVGAVLLVAIAVIDLVHTIDDVLAVPATLTQNLVAFSQSAMFLVIAGLAAWKGRQGGEAAGTAVTVGFAALLAGFGFTHTPTLLSAHVATLLPVAFSRFVVALNLALLVPLVLMAVFASEFWGRGRDVDAQPAEAGAT